MRSFAALAFAVTALASVAIAQSPAPTTWGFEQRMTWLTMRISNANRHNVITHAEYLRDIAKVKAIRKEVYKWDEAHGGKIPPQELDRIYGEINAVDDGIKWLKRPADQRPF